ncbi:Undecaprenyl pyrophosphate synthase [Archaeoglobus sulfaticallidus PM70-1]|uniref:Undecaprenyl pyrophosphate synthase n=1 Tax=Archaeoglobus sulfaticallidus PM70-1 TaxID=387631 RepID=N0BE36_9EURY|nr:undecaprenyl diphosphate synthase family protein [Archaeoglobus sulfaticallidus]AGK61278.1 Undecaprenyl pyrophosphate synthase [Archaeoglobus sulfaticallidus PM70-1]
MIDFVRKLYEKKLENNIRKENIPKHIMIIADHNEFFEFSKTFNRFKNYSKKFGVKLVTICLNAEDPESIRDRILSVFSDECVRIITPENEFVRNHGGCGFWINFIIGYEGKSEIVDAVKKIAAEVKEGKLRIGEITEKDIEKHLKIKNPPDLIIRAGEKIPEFLLWQSIYSELYFLDADWRNFRYIDFLRCIREYQRRERRFGK